MQKLTKYLIKIESIMKKNVMKIAFAVVAGYGVSNSQQTEVMSDLMAANVEALALSDPEANENGCARAEDLCSVLVIYSDGTWGEDFFYDYTKVPGWL